MPGHTNLASQEDVLRLRHRAVRRGEQQNGTVHLSRAGNHVLDIIRVHRIVDVQA